MKRCVIFAHYDKDSIIDDYVVYYLSELKKIADKIIFVSDCNVSKRELEKLQQYIHHSIIGKHGEYDFGSYKRGFQYCLKNNLINKYDELIFANDSCYAPLFPFEQMFQMMEKKNIDFWGNTANFSSKFRNIKHIQSYFVVFKPKVFKSEVFKNFINSVTKEKTKKDIILKYECGLTTSLDKAGFKWDVYCKLSKNFQDTHILYFKELVKENKSPFLKRSIPALNSMFSEQIFNIKRFLSLNTNYNCIVEYPKYFTFGVVKYFIRKYILRRIY